MRIPAGLLLIALVLGGCTDETSSVDVPGHPGASKTSADVRAKRRAYDGAPPVIAHEPMGMGCTECHTKAGRHVENVGFAPPSPHGDTMGMSDSSRCQQCHVFKQTEKEFRANDFAGLRQDLRRGRRHHVLAPPVIPHGVFMRENCTACHSGPAAREEIRCSHPERDRCVQCHVSSTTASVFPPR